MNDEAVNDRAVAEQGWGPTLRMSLLIFVRGLAHRLAVAREGRSAGKVACVAITVACGAVSGYAKARGWV
jgi:hypothetical protein